MPRRGKSEPEQEPILTIRAKGILDDSLSLDDAIAAVEAFLAELRDYKAKGFYVAEQVADDYMLLMPPRQ